MSATSGTETGSGMGERIYTHQHDPVDVLAYFRSFTSKLLSEANDVAYNESLTDHSASLAVALPGAAASSRACQTDMSVVAPSQDGYGVHFCWLPAGDGLFAVNKPVDRRN